MNPHRHSGKTGFTINTYPLPETRNVVQHDEEALKERINRSYGIDDIRYIACNRVVYSLLFYANYRRMVIKPVAGITAAESDCDIASLQAIRKLLRAL